MSARVKSGWGQRRPRRPLARRLRRRPVLVASHDCHLCELYNAYRTTNGWKAASGAVFDLRSDALRPDGWTSADAAGPPILPGLVRPPEIRAGHIDHALRFTVSRTQLGYIHPATHQAGATTSRYVPPMGARFRLKAVPGSAFEAVATGRVRH